MRGGLLVMKAETEAAAEGGAEAWEPGVEAAAGGGEADMVGC